MSTIRETLIHGFFRKQQYAAIPERKLTIKLSKVLCLECFMDMDSLVLAYQQGGTVNETNVCALAPKHLLYEQSQRDSHFFLQFNKAVVRNNLWEEMPHTLVGLFQMEMFQTTITRAMKKYHDKHNFRFGHGEITEIFAFPCCFKHIYCHQGIKKFAEFKISEAKSSAIQNNSITLLSVTIAIIVCKTL